MESVYLLPVFFVYCSLRRNAFNTWTDNRLRPR